MKNKKILFSMIMILMILILAGGVGVTLYFTTDMLKTNDQLFAQYLLEENQIETIFQSEKVKEQKEIKQANSYTTEGKLSVSLASREQTVELAQLDINSQYNKENERTRTEATLKKEQEELLKFSYINSNDIYGVKCDSIYEHYIGIRNKDLKEFARNMGIPEEQVSQIPDSISIAANTKNLIDEQDCQYLADVYLPIITNSISKEKYSKREEMIVVSGQTYNTNAYTLTLNQDEIRQIVTNVITKAKTDSATIEILENVITSLKTEQNAEEPISVEDLLQNMLEKVEEATQSPMNIEITVYEANGKKIRTQINVNDEISIIFDVVENKEKMQKVNLVIDGILIDEEETRIEMTLQKNVIGEKGIAMPEAIEHRLEMTIENSEGVYIVNANVMLGEETKEINFAIKDENENILQIDYNEKIQITNDSPAEIEELKNSNTVIVNDYPREQLVPFAYSIMQKAVEVFEEVVQKLNVI